MAAFSEMNFEHIHLLDYFSCFVSTSSAGNHIYDIVSTHCDGNLKHYLAEPETFRTRPGLSADLVAAKKDLMYQCASGIGYLHSLNVSHRCLKPENVLVIENHRNPFFYDNESGVTVKLSDFGSYGYHLQNRQQRGSLELILETGY